MSMFPQRTLFCRGHIIGEVTTTEADALLEKWQATPSEQEREMDRLRDEADWEHDHGSRESYMAACEAWREAQRAFHAACRADVRAVEAARVERWAAEEAARDAKRKTAESTNA